MSPLANPYYVIFSVEALRELAALDDPWREALWQRSRDLAELAQAAPLSGQTGDRFIFRLEEQGRGLLFEVQKVAKLLVIQHFAFAEPAGTKLEQAG